MLAAVRSELHYYCSNFTPSRFTPPVLRDKNRAISVLLSIILLAQRGFNLATSICSFSQDAHKIIFCLKEITSENRNALRTFESHLNYVVFYQEDLGVVFSWFEGL